MGQALRDRERERKGKKKKTCCCVLRNFPSNMLLAKRLCEVLILKSFGWARKRSKWRNKQPENCDDCFMTASKTVSTLFSSYAIQ